MGLRLFHLPPYINGYAAHVRGYRYIVFLTIIIHKSRLKKNSNYLVLNYKDTHLCRNPQIFFAQNSRNPQIFITVLFLLCLILLFYKFRWYRNRAFSCARHFESGLCEQTILLLILRSYPTHPNQFRQCN